MLQHALLMLQRQAKEETAESFYSPSIYKKQLENDLNEPALAPPVVSGCAELSAQ